MFVEVRRFEELPLGHRDRISLALASGVAVTMVMASHYVLWAIPLGLPGWAFLLQWLDRLI